VRAERLAAALRENLKRRKAQARGRQSDAAGRLDDGRLDDGLADGGQADGGQADVPSAPVDNGNT